MSRLPLLLLLLLLPALTMSARCTRPANLSPELVRYATSFTPYRVYSPTNCFEAWDDAASLLAALELHRLGANTGFEVTPAEAEPYVRHMAEEVLEQFYDADAPNGWGPCNGHVAVPLPDPPSGVAAMTYIRKRFGGAWSQETVDVLRRAIHLPDWKFDQDKPYVYNKTIPFPAMYLLFGESECHAPSWERGWSQLRNMYGSHMATGGFEANDRHYTMYHFANLGLMLDGLDSPTPKSMALNLYDLKALLSAHLYLLGGHIGVLNTRMGSDPYYFPGTQREMDMGPMLQAMGVGGDFRFASTYFPARPSVVVAEMLKQKRPLPLPIRELFFDKGQGYDAWWRMRSSKGSSRYPGTLSNLGESGKLGFAWQWHVLPGGEAAIGSSYGEWAIASGNSEGVAVRCPACEQGFAFVYQWQPCAAGDTDDRGSGVCSSGDPDPANEKRPLYDFERMQVHRSRITLFDPRERLSRWPDSAALTVVRGHELSQTWLTNWDHPAVGGEKIFPTAGGWYVGRVGDILVSYRPLGDTVTSTQKNGATLAGPPAVGLATFFQMPGRSGGITEIALAGDFPGDTLADFAADMDARFWSFTADGPNGGPVAEFDYRDANGDLCRMKLEYMGVGGLPGKERRFIDCSAQAQLGSNYQEQGEAEFFAALYGGAPIASPFVAYDRSSDVLTVPVPNGQDVVYDLGSVRTAADTVIPPIGCVDRAYLEFAEAEADILTSSGTGIPGLDLTLDNTGFAPVTARFEFVADDCTAGSAGPNTGWLLAPDDLFLATGAGGPLQVQGGAGSCDPGQYSGELIVSSAEANAPVVRLPVSLSVGP